MGKDGSWEVAVSRTQKVGNFLTVAVFREHGPQERIHAVNEHQEPARASNGNLWGEYLQPLAVSPSSSWWWTSDRGAQRTYTDGVRATGDLGCLKHGRKAEVHVQLCLAYLLSLISFHCPRKIIPTNFFLPSHFLTDHILTVSRITHIFLLIRNNSSLLYQEAPSSLWPRLHCCLTKSFPPSQPVLPATSLDNDGWKKERKIAS